MLLIVSLAFCAFLCFDHVLVRALTVFYVRPVLVLLCVCKYVCVLFLCAVCVLCLCALCALRLSVLGFVRVRVCVLCA